LAAGKWICALAAALTVFLIAPTLSAATDSDLKFAYAFKVEASNGYSIIALAANERADGKGEILLFTERRDGGAVYAAPATLTATSLTADLGPLGKVDLAVSASGRKKRLPPGCGEERKPIAYEPPRFSGTFEFHGEEGYTEATSQAPREYTRFFAELVCPSLGSERSGGRLAGARLELHLRRGSFGFDLQASENRPGGRSRFHVEVHEKRGRIAISRSTTAWLGGQAFRFDPALDKATVDPPAPFSGRATFRRDRVDSGRWAGDLSVDLPGRSDVPLAGPGIAATLTHACLQAEGAGRRADCASR
jgi:hypothetical protein